MISRERVNELLDKRDDAMLELAGNPVLAEYVENVIEEALLECVLDDKAGKDGTPARVAVGSSITKEPRGAFVFVVNGRALFPLAEEKICMAFKCADLSMLNVFDKNKVLHTAWKRGLVKAEKEGYVVLKREPDYYVEGVWLGDGWEIYWKR